MMDLEEIILCFGGGPNKIVRVLIRKRQEEGQGQRRRWGAGSRGWRDVGGILKLEKIKEMDSSLKLP